MIFGEPYFPQVIGELFAFAILSKRSQYLVNYYALVPTRRISMRSQQSLVSTETYLYQKEITTRLGIPPIPV